MLISALLALVVVSAFFSSSETAMMALNRYRLRHLANTGNRGAKRASKMLERPDKLLGLILIGNNLANNAAAALAGIIAYNLYGDAAVAVATLILTLVMLVFAEVTPKTIAAYRPERIAFPATIVLKPLMFVLYPAVWLINHMAGVLVRLFGVNPASAREDALSADELRTLMGTTSHRIPDKNQGMLINILDLDTVTIDDIMVPRNEVYGIDLNDSDETISHKILTSNYTRLPVFEDDINNIIGVIHLRNAPRLYSKGPFNRAKLRQLLHDPYFIPENTLLHVQLHNFQKAKHRIGVVVDEYGAVTGIVTLEDILEEIVGEFTSDIADTIDDIVVQEDGSYQIDAAATVREINKALGWKLPTQGPRTLNGLLLEELEAIPDNCVCVVIGEYRFEVTEMGENRIQSVLACKP
jgi:Mg2+/Co2+ transporter CorB